MLGLAHQFLDHLACLAGSESVPKFVPEAVIGRVCGDLEQVRVQASGVAVDGHIIVVQDDEYVGTAVPGVVQSLQGEAACHSSVPDDCNHFLLPSGNPGGFRETQGCGNRGGCMPDSEGVIFTFIPVGESADPVPLPVLPESFHPARQDLVGIGLVADVEDYPVRRGVVDIVDADGEVHCSEAGSKVAGIARTAFHDVSADFSAQGFQFLRDEGLQV